MYFLGVCVPKIIQNYRIIVFIKCQTKIRNGVFSYKVDITKKRL